MTGALVLRPEPASTATASALAALGVDVLRQPLFATRPIAWQPPDPDGFDAVMLTSANAARYGGAGLLALGLPAIVVGAATGEAARSAGLSVVLTGDRGAADLAAVARARGFTRLLHVTGRDRVAVAGVCAIVAYASETLLIPSGVAATWEGKVALLHSARAALRFGELVDRDRASRARIAVAALSPAVARAAGAGWSRVVAAAAPIDAALIAVVAAMIDPLVGAGDRRRR